MMRLMIQFRTLIAAARSASIKAITGTIVQMSKITTTISLAMEEQGSAAQEIARNIQSVAAG